MLFSSALPRRFRTKAGGFAVLFALALACAVPAALVAPAPAAHADGLERKKPRPAVKPRPAAPVAPRRAPEPVATPRPEAPPVVITPVSTDIRLSDGFFNGGGGVGAGVEGAGNSVVAGGSVFLNGSNRFSGIGGVSIVRTGFTFSGRSGGTGRSGGGYGHGSGGRAG